MNQRKVNSNDVTYSLTTRKVIVLFTLIGFLVYFYGLFNGFVWDDNIFIIQNPEVHSLNIIKSFSNNRFNDHGYYRPIPALYFSMLYMLYGTNAFLYHVTQLLMHISVVTLIYFVFKRFFTKELAFVLSLIFLIHPVNVESVAFIGASQSQLFSIFGLSALLLPLKDLKSNLIFFLLSLLMLLTKEVAILYSVLIVVFYLFFKKRDVLKILLIQVAAIITYLGIRIGVSGVHFSYIDIIPIAKLPLSERLYNIPAILLHYITVLIFPKNLSVNQQWIIKSVNMYDFYIPLCLVSLLFLVLLLIVFSIYKNYRKAFSAVLFFGIWLVIGLGSLLQIFPLDMTVAERWLYFPLIGVLGLIGIFWIYLQSISKRFNKLIYYSTIGILIVFSIRTMIRTTNWVDEITLYSHDAKIHDNYDIETNLSTAYFVKGDIQNSLLHAKKSVDYFPYEQNLNNLGTNYLYAEKLELAKQTYKLALNSKHYSAIPQKHLSGTYKRLAWTQLYSNELLDAKDTITKGLSEYPNDSQLWYELALCEYKLNNYNDAVNAIDKAKNLDAYNTSISYLYTQINNKQPIQIGSPEVSIEIKDQ